MISVYVNGVFIQSYASVECALDAVWSFRKFCPGMHIAIKLEQRIFTD